MITSEGFANRLIDPWVREFGLDGRQLGSLPVPTPFLPNAAATRGVRQNLGFESAATPPNGHFFFTATENALVQDGPPATVGCGSPSRLLRHNLHAGRARPPVRLLDGSDRRAARAGEPVRGQRPCRGAAAEQPVHALDGALVLGRRTGHRQHDQALRRRAPRRGRRQRLRQPGDAARRYQARSRRRCSSTWTSSGSRSTTSRE